MFNRSSDVTYIIQINVSELRLLSVYCALNLVPAVGLVLFYRSIEQLTVNHLKGLQMLGYMSARVNIFFQNLEHISHCYRGQKQAP